MAPPMIAIDAVDGSSTGTGVPWMREAARVKWSLIQPPANSIYGHTPGHSNSRTSSFKSLQMRE
jgi:hypothetical protein